MSYSQREDVRDAQAWLAANIRSTKDVEKLADMLRLAYHCFDKTGCRASAVTDTISHFYGRSHWTPTILAANEILRRYYGNLWNYAGD
jgi:hypothetical protein